MEVEIRRLTKDYGRHRVLQDVNLHIAGGMFGLLGPNGAGKTTLMRILTTLLLPTAGTVTVAGHDVVKEPGWVRQHLGYIPQDFGFYKNLTAFEVLDYIGTMKNLPPARRRIEVPQVLGEVNLTREAHRRVGRFSGGMRQRLAIAQALLGSPALIVVDEPTAGLDPEERIRFRNLLARLARDRTVILSTHIVGDFEASCSGVAVLNRGRLVFSGAPEALLAQARGRVWQVELRADELAEAEAGLAVVSSRVVPGGMELRVVAHERPPGRSQPVEPTLEDGYLAVMQSLSPEAGRVHA